MAHSTVKDKHSDKQENVITLQSHCAAHCCAEASGSGIMGKRRDRGAARDSVFAHNRETDSLGHEKVSSDTFS